MTNQQKHLQDAQTRDVHNQNRDKASDLTTYSGFLVRLWKDGTHGLWRCSAQSVQTGEVVRFASLTELFAFLEAQTQNASEEEERVGWRSPPGRKGIE